MLPGRLIGRFAGVLPEIIFGRLPGIGRFPRSRQTSRKAGFSECFRNCFGKLPGIGRERHPGKVPGRLPGRIPGRMPGKVPGTLPGMSP
jgi:hypothetical protein